MDIASACLAGIPCRYDGQARTDDKIKRMADAGEVKLVCPECLAGLISPRCPSEIVGGSGEDVLAGKAKVMGQDGTDRTEAFVMGARKTLAIAQSCGAQKAHMKAKSPSCGCGRIYDGRFSGTLTEGDGVAAALLKQNGIETIEV